ncbi:MAG: Valine--tRNA ligase [Syntrophorhabdaceae bacterium PtaU1.Bin034]|nr:MAG: Valine--tRNA ligase [Syntrophorhabdaceae bacterium PtaU1.Bin034]
MIDKVYDPKQVERKWYTYWKEKDYFRAESVSSKPPFCIVIPPPNVTGVLHMGHALNNTLQDIIVRFKRMSGFNALWLPGTDHAGIATQNVVERELLKDGLRPEHIGRDAFIKKVWEWKEKSGGTIIEQLKRLGSSCDWSRERFTMDEGLSRAVREVFVRLFEEGLIYRGDYIINWCPRCKTALSDVEVEHEETKGHLYYIRYPFADGGGHVVVATTRPETLLGDTAVAVNPNDPRYASLVGRQMILPLVNKKIPVIGDTYVDMEFGTGALKITPGHDFNDFEIGKKHHLEVIKVIDDDGRMNDRAFQYKGLDRFEARDRMIEDLRTAGLLEKIEDYPLVVGRCYRCKTVVEPIVSLQWFVRMKPLAEPAIQAVRDHRVRIIPEMWEKVYFEWMENIKDWCISRQIWWGHRIPVWYCDACNEFYVSREDITSCRTCGGPVRQESDVLDTWFSSGLWPFSTLGWPDETDDLKTFYPTSLLITGFDILFFWVARMIMMGLHFRNDVPFREVYIHALVRDAEGKKMSKSKGNVIDPLLMIDKYGTDAFRFTFAMLAAQGRDVLLSEERIEGTRNFVNKIWNASRLTATLLENVTFEPGYKPSSFLPDRWIRSRLQQVAKEVAEAIDAYRFSDAAHTLYSFVWHEFCDWYLELIKPNLYGKVTAFDAGVTAANLHATFIDMLKLLHPFMPFVTEEIYQRMPFRKDESIMVAPFPKVEQDEVDEEGETQMGMIMGIIDAIRNIRGEMGFPPSTKVDVEIRANGHRPLLETYGYYVKELARVSEIGYVTDHAPERAAIGIFRDVEVFVPIRDPEVIHREQARVEKELAKVTQEIDRLFNKLNNRAFREKAPAAILQKEEANFEELRVKREKLLASKGMLEGLLRS